MSADLPPLDLDRDELIQNLRRKQGSWLDWAAACQQLQKAGMNPQAIFENTGFEPIQQNQIVVGSQVYRGLESSGADPGVLEHFGAKASDVLYELRILAPQERVAVAALALAKGLDSLEVHEVVRSVRSYGQLRQQPQGFGDLPGDAVAYYAWRLARQTEDLQERSRLIARALKFVETATARQQVESLLTDFSVQPQRPAPRIPSYRLESGSEIPRLIPVAGTSPLSEQDLQKVPALEMRDPFGLVQVTEPGELLALPGWPPVLAARDPAVIFWDSGQLSMLDSSQGSEQVLVLVDRQAHEWQPHHYFLLERGGSLEVVWFEEAPEEGLVAQVLMVIRAPRMLDEKAHQAPWTLEE